jgi:hypothetical protein
MDTLVRKKIKPPRRSTSIGRENYVRVSRKANWIRCSEMLKNGGSQRSAGQVRDPGRRLSSIARGGDGEGQYRLLIRDRRRVCWEQLNEVGWRGQRVGPEGATVGGRHRGVVERSKETCIWTWLAASLEQREDIV